MNVCLFFEGTGQGVAGKITNVTWLRDLCAADARQKLHLEAGPGTHFGSYLAGKIASVDWRTTFRSARRLGSMSRLMKFSGRDPNGVDDFGVKIARFCKITQNPLGTVPRRECR